MSDKLIDDDLDALVLEHPMAVYIVSNDCDLAVSGNTFLQFPYVIAFPKNTS